MIPRVLEASALFSTRHPSLDMVCSRLALRQLAEACVQGGGHEFALLNPGGEVEGWGAAERLEIDADEARDRLEITRDGTTIQLRGNGSSLQAVAASLRNLASMEPRPSVNAVRPHVDLEYFEGHEFLAPSAHGLTIALEEPPRFS